MIAAQSPDELDERRVRTSARLVSDEALDLDVTALLL
jgi:hypothetical protein